MPRNAPFAIVAKEYRALVWAGIAGMAEEALCVLWRDGIERWPEGLMQGVGGAGGEFAQPADPVKRGQDQWRHLNTALALTAGMRFPDGQ